MPLVTIDVARIKLAAIALDAVDPKRELRDPTNQAIRLSAVQNSGGTVVAPSVLLDRIEELLSSTEQSPSESSNLQSEISDQPESAIADPDMSDLYPEIDSDPTPTA